MLTSARRGLSYPNPATRADTSDVARDIQTVINALELDVVFAQGTHAARPAPGAGAPAASSGGRLYWETDTSFLYYDNGGAWIGPLNVSALSANSITTAMLQDDSVTAAKIAAGAVGASEIADGSIALAEIAATLIPSQGAGNAAEALRALGTAAGQAARGDLSVTVWAESLASQSPPGIAAANTWVSYGATYGCPITIPATGTWEITWSWTHDSAVNINRIRRDRIGVGINGSTPTSALDRPSPRTPAGGAPYSARTRVALNLNDTLTLFGQTESDNLEGYVSTSNRSLRAQRIA